ncbi:response regulator transcription factor [Flavobacterium quisquiliarum]|uniref:Response regulator transcription factor n=1 Tax=Flavobacterium quisquiliarum TaxID=1834436 RepID=A0ABV8W3M6_9FLAO|nr:response regulator transcription factor [Flavobacterium quisquiliarum]MBW1658799.1 response regulator [Flavobacterium quisquiliarum]NWL02958.1 DNA-binding response regulator [Flavobacterium collinsii]
MNVLLIEDDKRISEFIVKGLEENNFTVHLAETGEIARDLIQQDIWDIILMDIMLPGIDGIQLVKLMRFKKNHTPVLMLSALSDTDDKVNALDSGADDYLVKPFHFKELISRVNALTRRTKFNYDKEETLYTLGSLTINPAEHKVTENNNLIDLSPREYKLLLYLLENRNKVIPRTQILNAVWGINYDNNTNVVDVYISYLRNKIEQNHKFIHTIKGTGYMLKEEL